MSGNNYFSNNCLTFIAFMDITITKESARMSFEIIFVAIIGLKICETLTSKCFNDFIVRFDSKY